MAERPRSGESSEEPDGQRRFDWLYGGKQDGSGADARPDADPNATRRIPVQPRPGQARPSTPAAAYGATDPDRVRPAPTPQQPQQPQQPGGPGEPPGTSYRSRGWRPRRPRFRLRYVFLLVLAWVVFLAATPFYAYSQMTSVEFEPRGGQRPAEQPGTTYLLVGSDSRAGLTQQERRELGTGNATGQRTDTIMLLHTGSGPNLLMSIPRDSLVDVPGYGTTKINAAFAFGGPRLLTKTIEKNTGIRVDHYVEIGLGGFVSLVDAVGGVEICPEMAMKDPLANLDVKKGCQEADGATALGYARSRKLYTDLGDIKRARAQREVVSSIGSEVLSPWTVVNPVRYWRLNMAATDFVTFGDGTNPLRVGLWAMAMTRVDGEAGLTCSVPIRDLAVNWDPVRAPEMFQAIIDDDTDRIGKDLCSPSGLANG